MPVPSPKAIADFLRYQAQLFSDGKLDEFMAAFKEFAPGGFAVEDPAGSEARKGWHVLEELCHQYVGWKIYVEDVKVSHNEAAIYVRNEGEFDGQAVKVYSIEHYVFGEDGSMLARYFHPMAED